MRIQNFGFVRRRRIRRFRSGQIREFEVSDLDRKGRFETSDLDRNRKYEASGLDEGGGGTEGREETTRGRLS